MNNRQLTNIAIAVVIIVTVVALTTNITKLMRRLFGTESDFIDHEDTPLPDGEIGEDFTTDPYVARLTEVLTPYMFDASPRCDIYRRLIQELSDPEFVMVCNEYNNTVGRPLRRDMDLTWQNGCTIFARQWDRAVYRRMNDLNVIG